ncbi:MAG: M28 family peptidase [Deltaproteobacteria bacterium]|nr:M28 family peptidase [Deltaproteobacteria bacterium]
MTDPADRSPTMTVPPTRFLLTLAIALILSCGPEVTPPPVDVLGAIKADRGAEVVKQLTSAETEGRGTAGKGLEVAANYLAGRLAEAGLRPGGDSGGFFQRFQVTTGVKLQDKRNWVRFGEGPARRSLKLDIEFTPLALAAGDARAAGNLVFVGYGITAAEADYDDYAGLDVKGKVVVAMRHAPGARLQEKGTGGPAGRKPVPALYQELRFKAMNAREHGAAALVVFNGPRSEGAAADALIKLGAIQGQDDAGIPVVQVIRPVLEELLGAEKIRESQEQIDTTFTPRSFPASETMPQLKIQTALDRERKEVANVVGVVEGADPALQGEWVVVGAHYDHLGRGGPGSAAPDAQAVHPGADDNASGVAALCAVADAMGKARPKRSVAFVAFAGEELGLLGAAHYARSAKGKLVAMINLDMVGRLRDGQLMVQGTDTAKEWQEVIGAANTDNLQLGGAGESYGPSDHTVFSRRGVPALLLFTGAHADYHRPTDTVDKLSFPGIEKVARFAFRLARTVADRPAALTYVRATRPAAAK